MNRYVIGLLFAAAVAAAVPARAQLQVASSDTVESVLRAQKDKRVTVRLRSGQEMTGIVRASSARLLHLGAISGKEFFDAAVPLEAIDAVLVRVKD